jgi:transglutaminase-like putative cysteine protease
LVTELAWLGALPAAAWGAKISAADSEILRLGPEIEEFVDARVRSNDDPEGTLRALINAVFAPDGLGITYGNIRTKTPSETFVTRSGNCLFFAMLFVSMARHVGLEVARRARFSHRVGGRISAAWAAAQGRAEPCQSLKLTDDEAERQNLLQRLEEIRAGT